MIIEKYIDVSMGIVLSRAETINNYSKVEAITGQDLNYYLGKKDISVEKNIVKVQTEKINSYPLTQKDDILISVISRNAMVISDEYSKKLVSSNFFRIKILDKEKLDPYYLCWQINENISVIKYFDSIKQGGIISILKRQDINNINIKIPSIDIQRKFGKIYYLNLKRIQLENELLNKINKKNNFLLNKYYEKEVKNHEN